MLKKFIKTVNLILAVIFVVSAFTACGAGKSESNVTTPPPASGASSGNYEWEYQEDTSPFEFTMWFPGIWGWGRGSVANGWDDSDVFAYITEQTGGKIIYDIPPGSEAELAGPMLAAGTYPDVVVYSGWTSPFINQMINANQVHSWTDLIDKYAPKMWDLISDSQMAYHKSPDGKLWKYVGFEYGPDWAAESIKLGNKAAAGGAHGTNIMFCRQDMLSAYGKADITDLDDFTNYLRFVKENFGNQNVDPIKLFVGNPRGELFTHFRGTFGVHASATYPQSDNTVKHFMYDPAYVDYLKWLNMLFLEGIITQNQLADDGIAHEQKLYSGDYGAIMSATYTAYNTLETTLKEAYGEDTDKLYIAVGPIAKQGISWYAPKLRGKGNQATLITTNAKQPDRIIKFFEFLLTHEGQMTINGGVEGKQWEWVNGAWTPDPEMAALCASDLEAYCTKYKLNGTWSPWCNTIYWEGLLGQILSPPGRPVDENNKRLGPEHVYDFWADGFAGVAESIEVGTDLDIIKKRIDDECMVVAMNMIVAPNETAFQKLYEDCLAEIERMGVKDVEAAYTAEHQEQLKALGKL